MSATNQNFAYNGNSTTFDGLYSNQIIKQTFLFRPNPLPVLPLVNNFSVDLYLRLIGKLCYVEGVTIIPPLTPVNPVTFNKFETDIAVLNQMFRPTSDQWMTITMENGAGLYPAILKIESTGKLTIYNDGGGAFQVGVELSKPSTIYSLI